MWRKKKEPYFIFEVPKRKKPRRHKHWFREMIEDERGALSSKRVIGVVAVILLFITFITSIFGITPDEYMAEVIALLAFGTLGLTSIDKFGWRRGKQNENSMFDYPDDGYYDPQQPNGFPIDDTLPQNYFGTDKSDKTGNEDLNQGKTNTEQTG